MSSLDHEGTLIHAPLAPRPSYRGHDKCALVMSSLEYERTLIDGT